MKTYHAVAERSGDQWAISVPELPGVFTQARTLARGEGMAKEAIALMLDVAADEVDVDLEPRDGIIDEARSTVARVRERRIRAVEEENASLVRVARDLTAIMSVRDAGRVMGLSYQRVSQLTATDEARRSNRVRRRAA